MSDFHPSSNLASKFLSSLKPLQKQLHLDPPSAFKVLKEEYHFGLESELWDDFIFSSLILPYLNKLLELEDQRTAINRYATIDELLFLPYIRRNEDPVRFKRAFWLVNAIGCQLASQTRFNSEVLTDNAHTPISTSTKNLLFILKGPYSLAHTEFLSAYLLGASQLKNICVTLLLLDAPSSSVPQALSTCHNLTVVSLSAHKKDVFTKVASVHSLLSKTPYEAVVWVACVQNLVLYMNSSLPVPRRIYWSMKYHSIIFPQLTHYAGLGFGGKPFIYDNQKWFRGRAFPLLEAPGHTRLATRNRIRKKHSIPNSAIVAGCFVRAEKLSDPSYWETIRQLLSKHSNLYFLLASQSLPRTVSHITSHPSLAKRFIYVGWVNTKHYSCALDLYLDSFPRGSCNTIFESVLSEVPFLIMDSPHNRESSALPYFLAHDEQFKAATTSPEDYVEKASQLIENTGLRSSLLNYQQSIMKKMLGDHSSFAADYTQYFLSVNQPSITLHK